MRRAAVIGSITIVLASSGSLAGAASAAAPVGFAARADTACAAAGAKIVALPSPTATTVVADVRSTQTIVTKLVIALKAIKPPTKQAKAYAAFIASDQQEATILKETLAAFKANQAAKLTQLGGQAATLVKRSNSQAKALGLPACAKTYTPSKRSSTAKTTSTTPAASTTHLPDAPTTTAVPAMTSPAPAPAATPVAPAAAGSASGTSSGSTGGGSTVSSGSSSQSATQNSSNTQSGTQSVGAGGVLLG